MRLNLVFAAAIALAPAAHAQTSGCALLEQIVTSASTGFADLKGEEIDDGWFDAKVWLADAEECSVEMKAMAEFSCVWDADTAAAANSKTAALSYSAKVCLPTWKVDDIAGRRSFNNLLIGKGVAMSGVGDREGNLLQIYTESFENSQESSTWLVMQRK